MENPNPMIADAHGVRSILYILGLLGTLGTWGRAAADGTLSRLFSALHGADEYILPGTDAALRKSFTGIYWPIDFLLDVLVIFFWEAVDGSHPATSAIGIHFLGQLFPVLVAFFMDSFRAGQGLGGRLPTLWLLLFQMRAIGCTGFVWALAYTATSLTTSSSLALDALRSASLVSSQMTLFILPTLMPGFVVPTIAMALPSSGVMTNDLKQLAIVAWNMYPLLVLGILKSLGALVPLFSGWRNERPAKSPQEHLRVVRLVCCTSLAMSSAIRMGVWAMSISITLFPAVFGATYAQELGPASVFFPPISVTRGRTVGDGVRSFFLWDQVFGFSVVILVMMLQHRTAVIARGLPTNWMKSVGMVILFSCTAGPGSACLALSWLRDEILFGSDGEASGKRKLG